MALGSRLPGLLHVEEASGAGERPLLAHVGPRVAQAQLDLTGAAVTSGGHSAEALKSVMDRNQIFIFTPLHLEWPKSVYVRLDEV